MNYETFKQSIVDSLKKHFGKDVTVSLHTVIKNNDLSLDGLTIEEPSVNISPTVYLNYYYEDYRMGKDFSKIVDEIIFSYYDHLPNENMDFSFFTDYQQVKYKIIYKLINYEKNQKLLADIPHFKFLDLAVVFCCFLSDTPHGNATILIHNHHIDIWHTTADVLYELAIKNTPILLPYENVSMESVLASMGNAMQITVPDFPVGLPMMYVLSNKAKLYGAAAILYPDVLAAFAKSQNSDLYIIPSSIHEVLLFRKNEHTSSLDLNQMINEVNASHVLPEEILSDHVYCFERASGFITY